MGRTKPSHLIAGLCGGYLPNLAEHYPSRREAIEALADYVERADFDGTLEYRGRVREGFILIGDFGYAEVIDCDDPAGCEIEDESL